MLVVTPTAAPFWLAKAAVPPGSNCRRPETAAAAATAAGSGWANPDLFADHPEQAPPDSTTASRLLSTSSFPQDFYSGGSSTTGSPAYDPPPVGFSISAAKLRIMPGYTYLMQFDADTGQLAVLLTTPSEMAAWPQGSVPLDLV
jgi:hypothetical protein